MSLYRSRGLRRFTAAAFAALMTLATAALLGPAAARATASPFTVYQVPTPAGGPCVVTTARDGSTWFLEALSNKLGRIDPSTGAITEYPIPWTGLPINSITDGLGLPARVSPISCALQTGADGNLYFANGLRNQIGSINPVTKQIALYQDSNLLGNLMPLNDITPGPDGAIWFTQSTANMVGRFDIYTHRFTDYPIPTAASLPIGIYGATDGGVWFTEAASGKMGRIDIATGAITEYATPTPLSMPFVIRAETDNRYLYFAELLADKIGRIDLQTRTITEFAIPTPASLPIADCTGADGAVYFTHLENPTLGRLDPVSGQVTEIPLPDALLATSGEITCGPGRAVWVIQLTGNRLVRYAIG